jgi:hypothetical protein
MTMLEKAAGAAYDAASGPECSGISERLAEKIARAVLTAVREPGDAVFNARAAADLNWEFGDGMTGEVWRELIDAILAEEPKG